ncbi:MAG: CBS domain-containing protein [Thermoplasmata archaeon]
MGLTAKDIMDPTVLIVDGELDVLACVRLMVDHGSGYAITAGVDHPVGGIFTEHDVLSRVLVPGLDPATVKVREVATIPVITCPFDLPMDEVASRMAEHRIRRIVVTHGHEVVGVVTSRHVLSYFRHFADQLSGDIAKFGTNPPTTGL